MAADGVLRGMRALVTGGSGGIGRAVAARLTRAGARVIITARTEASLRQAAAATGSEAIAADVADAADVERLARTFSARAGAPPDALVNAAGAFHLAPLAETRIDEFDRQLAVNLRAPFLLIRALLPAMIQRGNGHIVTIGSVAGRSAFPANGAYSASKFGVRGLHAVLAAELRGTGVRATLVEPAATDTALWNSVDRAQNPGLPDTGGMLSPDDVAEAVLFALTRPARAAVPNILLERA